MDDPKKPAPPKEAPKPKAPDDQDRLLVIQQYLDGLKEYIRKLRKRFH